MRHTYIRKAITDFRSDDIYFGRSLDCASTTAWNAFTYSNERPDDWESSPGRCALFLVSTPSITSSMTYSFDVSNANLHFGDIY